jgi:hypothetical protein
MTTQTKETLTQEAERMFRLSIDIGGETLQLVAKANQSVVYAGLRGGSEVYNAPVRKIIAYIEDAIKRYREGRPQAYEDD